MTNIVHYENTYLIKKSTIPKYCSAPLMKRYNSLCKNCNSYMFILSTGEQLFSCGIKKHMNYITSLTSPERKVYVFQKNTIDKKYDTCNYDTCNYDTCNYDTCNYDTCNYLKYDYKYEVEKVETNFDNPKDLKSIIGNTYQSCTLIQDCFIKMVELNVLMQNAHVKGEIFRLIEKEYDNNVALSIRYNSLVKLNQEYNNIYKEKFIIYKFPFQKSSTCSICFEDTSKNNSGNLPCGHAFHYHCISSWFNSSQGETQKCCPNCRVSFDISKYRFCRKITV